MAAGTERAYAGDTGAATARLRDAVAAAHALPAPRRDRFRRLAVALELTLARLAGDHPEVRRAAARLLATGVPAGVDLSGVPAGAGLVVAAVPTDEDPRTGEDADVRAVVGTALGLTDLAEGDLGTAGARFTEALAAARQAGRHRTELVGATRSALLLALAGELSPAEQTARAALAMPPCQGWSSRVDCGYAHLALALVALQRGQPAEATAELTAAVAVTGVTGGVPTSLFGDGTTGPPDVTGPAGAVVGPSARMVTGLTGGMVTGLTGGTVVGTAGGAVGRPLGEVIGGAVPRSLDGAVNGAATVGAVVALCRAALLRDAGEPAAAIEVVLRARDGLTGAGRLADGGVLAGAGELVDRLLALEADLRGEQGDLDTARRLLAGRVREPEPVPVLALALARVEFRAGDVRAAAQALPDWDAPGAADWPLSVRLAAGVLDAVLARRAGDERRAGRLLERVLDLAGRHGHRRVFTRAEPAVRDLLAAHLDSGTAHWPQVSELLRDAEQPVERVSGGPQRALEEPLTDRELTILRYLQSILSNVEIASELSLSVNTVKTHVRNIYRKLDATRRREAVHRARTLHLL